MIKTKKRKILLLPGAGIGPEGVSEVKKIINWFNKIKSLDFRTEEGLDDIALSLDQKTKIEIFDKDLKSSKPWIFND